MNPRKTANSVRYVIITPARDEARYVVETIKGVLAQTVAPAEWIIVDDGSTDCTASIVDRYAAQYPWISVIHRPNRGRRDVDTGAVGAFLAGYQALRSADWDFLVNLDADLCLEAEYFRRCFDQFAQEADLGIAGGILSHYAEDGSPVVEAGPTFHVRGATKIYRRACWEAIGGLSEVPGWDTIDEVRANMTGWRARSLPQIQALHQRPTGAVGGPWRDALKGGRTAYFLGYHPLFMLAKCCRRLVERPYVLAAGGHFCGFVGAYFAKNARLDDEPLVRYLRRQQLRRLLFMDSTWR